MIKGRTPNIRTEQLRTFANKLVTSTNNKWGNRPISGKKFNKLLEHAPVAYASKLRSGQKVVTIYQTKKFLGDFLKHIQEHKDYKVSTFARKALNVKLHQGDNVIENFNEKHIGEKGLSFVAKLQQEADAKANSGPTPEELIRQERLRQAHLAINKSVELRREDAGKKPSGFANPKAEPMYAIDHREAGTSATVRSKDVQTSVTGEVQVAGKVTAANTAPGKPTASTPLPGARGAVPMARGIGLHRFDGRPAAPAERNTMPTIVGASDTRGSAPSPSHAGESQDSEESVPTPGIKTEETAVHPSKEVDASEDEDIDRNLPLAA